MPRSRHPIVEADLDGILAAPLPWARLHGKTVLVTGAAGFLPAYMVETLLRLNEREPAAQVKVLGLVRDLARATERFSAYAGRPDLELVQHDIRSPWTFPKRAEFIVHAASPASPKQFGKDPTGTIEANLLGTVHGLRFALQNKAEGFLFFSSGEVYGQVDPERIPIAEDTFGYLDPATVRACYAEGKRAGETLCVAYADQFGVPAVIVRPFHTYGPGMALDDGRVFADFVADVVDGRDIHLKSDGRAVRAFCYLADATAGFFTALLLGKPGRAYNIGNPEAEISVGDLAARLLQLFPDPPRQLVRDNSPRDPGYLESPISRNSPDVSRISALGWRPATNLDRGFRRTVESFQ